MKTRRIKISDLQVGMKIKSSQDGQIVFKDVIDKFETVVQHDNQIRLQFENGTVLNCSNNHPIMIMRNGNLVEVYPEALTINDRVLTDQGFTRLLTIDIGQQNDTTYIDITVEGTNTFFASESIDGQMVLTHNSQGGIRNASATISFPIWHYQFDDLIVLKNNQGTEENRVRHLDYSVVMNKFFWKRFKKQGKITFFDPNEVPDLYDAFYSDSEKFEELYVMYEARTDLRTKTEPAETVIKDWLLKERGDTGRYYIMNVDNVMNQGPFDPSIHPIYQSNLCQEILLPTKGFRTVDDAGELCIEINGNEVKISNMSTVVLANGERKLVRFITPDDDVVSFLLEDGRELILPLENDNV